MPERLLTVSVWAWICVSAQVILAGQPWLRIWKGPTKSEYLVGEPVYVYYEIENSWARPLPVPTKNEKWVSVEIHVNGRRFIPDPLGKNVVERRMTLRPLQRQRYYFQLLYSFSNDNTAKRDHQTKQAPWDGLVFRRPGLYVIKIAIPEFESFREELGDLASGCIQKQDFDCYVRIKMPDKGSVERRIWQRIRREEVLKFLQTEGRLVEIPTVPLELAAILIKFPRSEYHDDLQFALRRYYEREKGTLGPAEKRLIQKALKLDVGTPLIVHDKLFIIGTPLESMLKQNKQ